jgi:hypothetical protein
MRKLSRVILINAAEFDYVEFPVGGHGQVIGVNGHGKSTLLRTLIFFYVGNNERAAYGLPETKKDFVTYYLGDSPAYLIYEVERENGAPPYHIAVTRPAGRIQFHFVDAPFRKEFYLDGTLVRPVDSVQEKLRDARCSFESVASYEEFGNRIYGLQPSTFAVFKPSYKNAATLAILPRIISGIFTVSQLNADKFKAALTCGVRADALATELDLTLLKHQLENFRRVNSAIKTYIRYEPEADALLETADQFSAKVSERLHAIEDLIRLAKRLPIEVQTVTDEKAALAKEEAEAESQFKTADSILQGEIEELGKDLAVIASKIEDGAKREQEYANRNIEQKNRELRRLPELREEQRLAETEHASLTAKYEDENQRKVNLIANVEQTFAALRAEHAIQRADVDRAMLLATQKAEQDRDALLKKFGEEEQLAKQQLLLRRKHLTTERQLVNGEYKALAGLKEPPELTTARKTIESNLGKQRDYGTRIDELRHNLEVENLKSDAERAKFDADAEKGREAISGTIEALNKEKSSAATVLDAFETSLANFFQKTAPQGWSSAVKTLNRETLLSNAESLHARLSDANPHSVWGVELSTDPIAEPQDEWDRKALTEKLSAVKQQLAEQHDNLTAAHDRYITAAAKAEKDATARRHATQTAIEVAKQSRQDLVDDNVRLTNQVATFEGEWKRLKEGKTASVQKRDSENAAVEEQLLKDEKATNDHWGQQRNALNESHREAIEQLSTEANQRRAQIEADEQSAAERRKLELTRIEQAFEQALHNKGANANLVQKARKRFNEAIENTNRVAAYESEVSTFLEIKRHFIDPLPSLRSQHFATEQVLNSKNERRMQLHEEHQQRCDSLKERRELLSKCSDELDRDGEALTHFRTDVRFAQELGYFERDDLVAVSLYRPEAIRGLLLNAQNAHSEKETLAKEGNDQARKFLNRFEPEVLDKKVLGFSPIHPFFDWFIFVGSELRPFVTYRTLTGMKQIQTQEFEQLIQNISRRNADFTAGIRQVKQTAELVEKRLQENNFVDVLDSIELKVNRVDTNLAQILAKLEEFAGLTFGTERDLFGKQADRVQVDKAIETFERLVREINNSKRERLELTDYFEFSIRVCENGHDMGWRKSLDEIGSTGTDYLLKMLIYLALIEVYREKALANPENSVVHCVMDETGVLAPKYVRKVLDYASSRGIVLITAGHSQQTTGFENWMRVCRRGKRFSGQIVLRKVLKCDP